MPSESDAKEEEAEIVGSEEPGRAHQMVRLRVGRTHHPLERPPHVRETADAPPSAGGHRAHRLQRPDLRLRGRRPPGPEASPPPVAGDRPHGLHQQRAGVPGLALERDPSCAGELAGSEGEVEEEERGARGDAVLEEEAEPPVGVAVWGAEDGAGDGGRAGAERGKDDGLAREHQDVRDPEQNAPPRRRLVVVVSFLAAGHVTIKFQSRIGGP